MPLALVTGASSGIGRAFAERLAADGHDLIVVGRRRERLEALASALADVEVRVLPADLATDEGISAVVAVCGERPLDMLVNNAGVAHYMPFADLSAEKARELVYVKTLAPTLLSRAALPGMLSAGAGAIINIAGMLAFSGPTGAAPAPGQRATYVASLAGTVAMSQVLGAELAGTGVGDPLRQVLEAGRLGCGPMQCHPSCSCRYRTSAGMVMLFRPCRAANLR